MGKTELTFGEIMMRLSPKAHLRIEQATEFDVRYGGAEANTALSLAYQGDKAAYVSVVPANRLGECALRSLKTYDVDITRVVRQGDRLGSYVFEVGASQRGNGCVYDRKYSAINMAKRDVFDWDEILKGIDAFYFSGVTPAVSDEMAAARKDALTACRAKGITTVCDVNYRGKMWSPEKSQATMKELLPLVDICIANDEDAPRRPWYDLRLRLPCPRHRGARHLRRDGPSDLHRVRLQEGRLGRPQHLLRRALHLDGYALRRRERRALVLPCSRRARAGGRCRRRRFQRRLGPRPHQRLRSAGRR